MSAIPSVEPPCREPDLYLLPASRETIEALPRLLRRDILYLLRLGRKISEAAARAHLSNARREKGVYGR